MTSTDTLTPAVASLQIQLDPEDNRRLANLCGPYAQHLRHIEKRLPIEIRQRGNQFTLIGPESLLEPVSTLLHLLYEETMDTELSANDIHLAIQASGIDNLPAAEIKIASATAQDDLADADEKSSSSSIIRTKKLTIKPRGLNQQRYVNSVRTNDINFGIGPAGTGKTYLAVACAVEALVKNEIERILLVRPAVEAGEKLGFLPGDLAQKVDPYLRPLYDALYEMLGFDTVGKLMERGIIEVAPLAFMRGRTLNNSFVILDESQNTTREQMKMFLTRIGFGTTAVITGDPTQTDLAKGMPSGLRHATEVLSEVNGISFTHFSAKDVVRHPLVQRIVEAYDAFEAKDKD